MVFYSSRFVQIASLAGYEHAEQVAIDTNKSPRIVRIHVLADDDDTEDEILETMDCTAWNYILFSLRIELYGTKKFNAGIITVINKAKAKNFEKLDIAVLVKTMDRTSTNPNVILVDPTGVIEATITTENIEAHAEGIEVGAVLVLHQVFAVKSEKSTNLNYYNDFLPGVHMTITSKNLLRVVGKDIVALPGYVRKALVPCYKKEAYNYQIPSTECKKRKRS